MLVTDLNFVYVYKIKSKEEHKYNKKIDYILVTLDGVFKKCDLYISFLTKVNIGNNILCTCLSAARGGRSGTACDTSAITQTRATLYCKQNIIEYKHIVKFWLSKCHIYVIILVKHSETKI